MQFVPLRTLVIIASFMINLLKLYNIMGLNTWCHSNSVSFKSHSISVTFKFCAVRERVALCALEPRSTDSLGTQHHNLNITLLEWHQVFTPNITISSNKAGRFYKYRQDMVLWVKFKTKHWVRTSAMMTSENVSTFFLNSKFSDEVSRRSAAASAHRGSMMGWRRAKSELFNKQWRGNIDV